MSVTAASFIPRRAPEVLAEGELSLPNRSSGRFTLPAAGDADVPVTLLLQWSQKPPRGMKVDLQVADSEGQDRLQKTLKIKPKGGGTHWQQTMDLHLSGGSIRTFSLALAGREPALTQYRFTAFAATPWLRFLRIGEMLFFPALAFVLLAVVMIVFPSFVQS